jgi:hypothetical protein
MVPVRLGLPSFNIDTVYLRIDVNVEEPAGGMVHHQGLIFNLGMIK